jgi:hypothetical protein
MEAVDDAAAVKGMAFDFVIWARTPSKEEYEAVDATLKGSEWGDHFWTCRRPR